MSVAITEATRAYLMGTVKEPNLAFEIEGVPTIYSTASAKRPVTIGDGHIIGDPEVDELAFYVGGLDDVGDQQVSVLMAGTSTSIKQQLDPFKGQGTSVSTLSVAFIDDGRMTELITPGEVVDDILQRKVLVRFGFQESSYPEDYTLVFRGFITDVTSDAGTVTFQLNGVNEKQRTNIFKKAEAELLTNLSATDTVITVDQVDNFLAPIVASDVFRSYVRIDDEIIEYKTIRPAGPDPALGRQIGDLTRGLFGTTPAPHDARAKVETLYRLKGNAIDLALQLMASGNALNGVRQPAYDDVVVTSVVTGGPDTYANAIYLDQVNFEETYNLIPGDIVEVTGSVDGANNVQGAVILDIIRGEAGDFLVLDRVLTPEVSPNLRARFFSQFNVLPDGCLMLPDEIDIAEHLRIRRLFMSSTNYDMWIKDTIDNAREFIEQQIYLPVSAYSLPRKARASIGYQIGPIPGTDVVTIDETNVKQPRNLKVQRSTNTNFYNEIVYAYNEALLEDEFQSGYIIISEASKTRIKGAPNRTLKIESKGLKSELGAEAIIVDKAKRRLDRYQYGAEQFTFSTLLDAGFTIEIGDIVNFDGRALGLPDIKTGAKGIAPRLLEVTNREFQLKTGDLKFTAVDTNFDGNARYGLISPSSKVQSAASAVEFTIAPSYSKRTGQAEYRKWQAGWGVRVRSANFSVMAESTIQSVSTANVIRLKVALPFTPTAGMVMEFTNYGSVVRTAGQRNVYAWFSGDDFADGTKPYVQL